MHDIISRRRVLSGLVSGLVGVWVATWPRLVLADDNKAITKIVKTDREWKKILTRDQYDVLRDEGTENPFSSPLLNEHRDGMFACVACDLPLFPSKFKFDSGTGWPSFYDVLTGHVETKEDHKMFITRTEYHCAQCGGHQGHVFPDGPEPTNLRYCNNGVALKFTPDKA